MVLTFDEALRVVLDCLPSAATPSTIELPLLMARRRVLAEPVMADRDQPPFDRATRDGFAVRAENWNTGDTLQIVGMVRAGQAWTGDPLRSDQAIEIMTGAPVPSGADAVAMIEHTLRNEGAMQAQGGRILKHGENIVRRGSEALAATSLIDSGTVLGSAEIALAAACGRSRLPVYRQPQVAILATGDELVEIDQTPGPNQIRNSNSYGIAALVEAAGGEPIRLPIARDDREDLLRLIGRGRHADLLVLSGGVSMGQYDLVEEVLKTLGAEFFFTGVKMQPGKPVVFGRLPATPEHSAQYFFGLPGNPVSTQVTFQVFVAPAIRALNGAGGAPPPFVLATLTEDIPGKPGLTRLLPARLTGTQVKLIGWQGSGDLAANARANCYLLLPADRERFTASEIVRVLLQ